MNTITWKVEVRKNAGKGVSRKIRRAGKIPAVAYGREIVTTPLNIESSLLEELLRSATWQQTLISLEADGATQFKDKYFMIREIQRHHVMYTPIAMDLLAIRLDQKIKVDVPLEIIGTAEIKKQGGVLEILHRSLAIKCLPTAIPAKIVIDAGKLKLNESLHLNEIELPEGVETDLPKDMPICTALTTRDEEAAKPAAEGAEAAAAPAAAAGDKKEVKKEEKK